CALAASGHAAAAPLMIFMKSRRRIAVPASKPRCSAFNFHHQNRKSQVAKRDSTPNVHCRNPGQRMSQVGHERRFRDVCGMSGLPPIATVERTFGIGSFVPEADVLLLGFLKLVLAQPPTNFTTLSGVLAYICSSNRFSGGTRDYSRIARS